MSRRTRTAGSAEGQVGGSRGMRSGLLRALLAAGLAAGAALGGARSAEACPLRCDPPEQPLQALAEADAVFQGRVVHVPGSWMDEQPAVRRTVRRLLPHGIKQALFDAGDSYVFEVDASWKGVDATRITVEADSMGSFAYELQEGESYVVYASHGEEDRRLYFVTCGRTRAIERAAEDLAALGPGTIELRDARANWAYVGGAAAASPLLLGVGLLASAVRRRRREALPRGAGRGT